MAIRWKKDDTQPKNKDFRDYLFENEYIEEDDFMDRHYYDFDEYY